jgi:hypothetical protein
MLDDSLSIRLRAAHRAGELLKDLEKAVGARGQLNGRTASGPATREAPEKQATLADLGIPISNPRTGSASPQSRRNLR